MSSDDKSRGSWIRARPLSASQTRTTFRDDPPGLVRRRLSLDCLPRWLGGSLWLGGSRCVSILSDSFSRGVFALTRTKFSLNSISYSLYMKLSQLQRYRTSVGSSHLGSSPKCLRMASRSASVSCGCQTSINKSTRVSSVASLKISCSNESSRMVTRPATQGRASPSPTRMVALPSAGTSSGR